MNLDDLKAQRRWVGFRSADDKAPMNLHTGRNASSKKGISRNAVIVQVLSKATAPRKAKRGE